MSWFQKWISLLKTKRNTPLTFARDLQPPSLSFECFCRKQSIFAVTQNHPLPTFLSSFGKSLFFLVTTGLNRRRRDVSAPLDNNSVTNFVFSRFLGIVWELPCFKSSRYVISATICVTWVSWQHWLDSFFSDPIYLKWTKDGLHNWLFKLYIHT